MQEMMDSIHDFSKTKVLVIGDVMIDQYWFGEVKRISPEAPVPVLDLVSIEDRLGGAANVALNLLAMGASVYMIGLIGDDFSGQKVSTLLKEVGIDDQFMVCSAHRKTTVKSRMMSQGQNLLRVDSEDVNDMNESEWQHCKMKFDECLQTIKPDVIILQDYNKGVLTQTSIRYFIKNANHQEIPVMVDPKKNNFWEYKDCTIFKPNLKEVKDALGIQTIGYSDLHKKLIEKSGHQFHFITLGADGILAGDQTEYQHFPTKKRNIVDVCGAGDTVLAVISLYWSKGLPASKIAELANIAGGQVCSVAGVTPVNKKLLLEEWAQHKNR